MSHWFRSPLGSQKFEGSEVVFKVQHGCVRITEYYWTKGSSGRSIKRYGEPSLIWLVGIGLLVMILFLPSGLLLVERGEKP